MEAGPQSQGILVPSRCAERVVALERGLQQVDLRVAQLLEAELQRRDGEQKVWEALAKKADATTVPSRTELAALEARLGQRASAEDELAGLFRICEGKAERSETTRLQQAVQELKLLLAQLDENLSCSIDDKVGKVQEGHDRLWRALAVEAANGRATAEELQSLWQHLREHAPPWAQQVEQRLDCCERTLSSKADVAAVASLGQLQDLSEQMTTKADVGRVPSMDAFRELEVALAAKVDVGQAPTMQHLAASEARASKVEVETAALRRELACLEKALRQGSGASAAAAAQTGSKMAALEREVERLEEALQGIRVTAAAAKQAAVDQAAASVGEGLAALQRQVYEALQAKADVQNVPTRDDLDSLSRMMMHSTGAQIEAMKAKARAADAAARRQVEDFERLEALVHQKANSADAAGQAALEVLHDQLQASSASTAQELQRLARALDGQVGAEAAEQRGELRRLGAALESHQAAVSEELRGLAGALEGQLGAEAAARRGELRRLEALLDGQRAAVCQDLQRIEADLRGKADSARAVSPEQLRCSDEHAAAGREALGKELRAVLEEQAQAAAAAGASSAADLETVRCALQRLVEAGPLATREEVQQLDQRLSSKTESIEAELQKQRDGLRLDVQRAADAPPAPAALALEPEAAPRRASEPAGDGVTSPRLLKRRRNGARSPAPVNPGRACR